MHSEQRQVELKMAFERVQDQTNWKNPIDAEIFISGMDEQILIHDAVVHFAGCVPSFLYVGNNTFRVKAVGYYFAVGA